MQFNSFTPIHRIPFFLVTGFLGSGKTTFLKNIINQFADDKKLAIIQNEFAQANIDGVELKETDKSFHLMEMNKGSVFCVCLLSDFRNSLRKFIDSYHPDAIFLEATGLSDPIAIAEILNDFDDTYLSHVWCIVDALNFQKTGSMITRVQHQVRIADTVLVNKTDLNSKTEDIHHFIKSLNPYCKIIETQNCGVQLAKIFDFNLSIAEKMKPENSKIESLGRPEINVAVLRTGKKISKIGLERFLEEYGTITYRLKGYVVLDSGKVMAVQSTFENYEITEIKNYRAATEIVAMGKEVSARELKKAFANNCTA